MLKVKSLSFLFIFFCLGLVAALIPTRLAAIGDVGAEVTQVSGGSLISVSGWHAPRSEVVVVDVGAGDEVVAAGIDEGNGRFSISFRATASQRANLWIFAIDQAAVTNRVALPTTGIANELLPPTLVVDPSFDTSDNDIRVGGYSHQGAIVTVTLESDNGLLATDVVEAAIDGGWEYAYVDLVPGTYTVVARSAFSGETSQSSQELIFVVEEPVAPRLTDVGDTVSKAVETVTDVLPPAAREAVRDVAPQAERAAETVTPVAAVSLLTQLTLFARDIFFIVLQAGISLMQYFGFLRKRNPWGVVYDSVTKQPVVLATVRLYELKGRVKKLIETDVTSKAGVFSFVPQAGTYVISVAKAGYSYPSRLVPGAEDGEYAHVYHGEAIDFVGAERPVEVSVPMDPKDVEISLRFKIVNFLRRRMYWLTIGSLVVGFVTSLLAVLGGAGGINGFFLLFYVVVLSIQGYLSYRKHKTWGVVTDRQGNKIGGVQLDLVDPKFEKLVQRRVSDRDGKYQFIVPEGEYEIRISSVGHKLVDNAPRTYQGQRILVKGAKPKLITLRLVVEKVEGQA